jgi:hypothetical protein
LECFSTSATIANQGQIMGGPNIVLQNTADKASYDNTTSGLTAVEVQAAIDELATTSSGVSGVPPTTVNAIVR